MFFAPFPTFSLPKGRDGLSPFAPDKQQDLNLEPLHS